MYVQNSTLLSSPHFQHSLFKFWQTEIEFSFRIATNVWSGVWYFVGDRLQKNPISKVDRIETDALKIERVASAACITYLFPLLLTCQYMVYYCSILYTSVAYCILVLPVDSFRVAAAIVIRFEAATTSPLPYLEYHSIS